MRFMAMARLVCASREMEPKLMAPVEKRLTMSAAASTSSSGTPSPVLNCIKPRKVSRRSLCSLMVWANS